MRSRHSDVKMSEQKGYHNEQTENIYRCGVCFENFSTEQTCYDHVLSHGSKDERNQTKMTTIKPGVSQETLTAIHNKKSIKKEHGSLKCDCCETFFSNILKLKRHLQHQRTVKEFHCRFCNMLCRKMSELMTHLRTHTNERPFKCDLCKKAFKRNTHLVQHRKLHSGDKPFICSQCKAAYADKCNLNRHVKLYHKHSDQTPKKFRSRKSRVSIVDNPVTHSSVDEKGSEKTNEGGSSVTENVHQLEQTSTLKDSGVKGLVSSGKEVSFKPCSDLTNSKKDIFEKEEREATSPTDDATDSKHIPMFNEKDRTETVYVRIGETCLVLSVHCEDKISKSPVVVRTDNGMLIPREPDCEDVLMSQESEDGNVVLSLESRETGSHTKSINRTDKDTSKFLVCHMSENRVSSGRSKLAVCGFKKIKAAHTVESGKCSPGWKARSATPNKADAEHKVMFPCVINADKKTEDVYRQNVKLVPVGRAGRCGAGSTHDTPQAVVPVGRAGRCGAGSTHDTPQAVGRAGCCGAGSTHDTPQAVVPVGRAGRCGAGSTHDTPQAVVPVGRAGRCGAGSTHDTPQAVVPVGRAGRCGAGSTHDTPQAVVPVGRAGRCGAGSTHDTPQAVIPVGRAGRCGTGSTHDTPQAVVPVGCAGRCGAGSTHDTPQAVVPVDIKDAAVRSGNVTCSQVSVVLRTKKGDTDTTSQNFVEDQKRHVNLMKESPVSPVSSIGQGLKPPQKELELDLGQSAVDCEHGHGNPEQQKTYSVLYECGYCGKKMKTESTLKYHVRTHTKDRAIRCNVCEKDFYKPSTYDVHMRSHTGLRPFCCGICKRRYRDNSTLRSHMKLHTGLNVFSCSVCKRVFPKQTELNSHFSIHTGDRPYLCQMCPKTFRTRHSLCRHVRCHTGDKPYPCPHCDLRFRDTSNRKKHVLKHHNLDSLQAAV
ncbi:zinc finger protein 91-like [Haliotis cracherodii]|uniref:zinc finger protein 91-like n=1 Tax=Haliotis cracherodii TaxID=6455 RepID=UPI0039ECD693